jgi:hypothetical protein
MPGWTGRPDIYAGTYLDALDIELILDQIDTLTAPTEGDYSSVYSWSSSGVSPGIGTSTVDARYWLVSGGLFARIELEVVYAGATFGNGVYFHNIPIIAAASCVGMPVGYAYALQTGTSEHGGIVKMETTTTFRVVPAVSTADDESNWSNTTPFTWNNGHTFRASLTIRVA